MGIKGGCMKRCVLFALIVLSLVLISTSNVFAAVNAESSAIINVGELVISGGNDSTYDPQAGIVNFWHPSIGADATTVNSVDRNVHGSDSVPSTLDQYSEHEHVGSSDGTFVPLSKSAQFSRATSGDPYVRGLSSTVSSPDNHLINQSGLSVRGGGEVAHANTSGNSYYFMGLISTTDNLTLTCTVDYELMAALSTDHADEIGSAQSNVFIELYNWTTGAMDLGNGASLYHYIHPDPERSETDRNSSAGQLSATPLNPH